MCVVICFEQRDLSEFLLLGLEAPQEKESSPWAQTCNDSKVMMRSWGRLWQPAAVNIRLKAPLNTLQLPVKDVYSSKDCPERMEVL